MRPWNKYFYRSQNSVRVNYSLVGHFTMPQLRRAFFINNVAADETPWLLPEMPNKVAETNMCQRMSYYSGAVLLKEGTKGREPHTEIYMF
mmetsp:Transcript_60243/g.119486  ORF Transcript_60243/g.119486 Transcript_60243/m.119486 type:complete len:90 (+) Transcript_60243:3-272(+)